MKYKIHKMLVVYRIIICFRGGCIYKRVDVMAVHTHNINTYYLALQTEQYPQGTQFSKSNCFT